MSQTAPKPPKANSAKSPKPTDSTPAPESITHKLARLDQAVEWFHSDEFSLDQAIAKYQSAAALAHEIEHDLTELKNQVAVIADLTKS